jgi:hypothetical protein
VSGGGTVTSGSDAYGQQVSYDTQGYGYDAVGRAVTDTTIGVGSTRTFVFSGTGNTLASDGTDTYGRDPSGVVVGVGVAAAGGGTVAGSGVLAFVDQHGCQVCWARRSSGRRRHGTTQRRRGRDAINVASLHSGAVQSMLRKRSTRQRRPNRISLSVPRLIQAEGITSSYSTSHKARSSFRAPSQMS